MKRLARLLLPIVLLSPPLAVAVQVVAPVAHACECWWTEYEYGWIQYCN